MCYFWQNNNNKESIILLTNDLKCSRELFVHPQPNIIYLYCNIFFIFISNNVINLEWRGTHAEHCMDHNPTKSADYFLLLSFFFWCYKSNNIDQTGQMNNRTCYLSFSPRYDIRACNSGYSCPFKIGNNKNSIIKIN